MASFTVVYDACVLYPASVRDLVVELARTGLMRAKWTEQIHNEWINAICRAGHERGRGGPPAARPESIVIAVAVGADAVELLREALGPGTYCQLYCQLWGGKGIRLGVAVLAVALVGNLALITFSWAPHGGARVYAVVALLWILALGALLLLVRLWRATVSRK